MEEHLTHLLQYLEPVVFAAGKHALALQGIGAEKKLETGIGEVDIVTRADLEAQELILSEWVKTPLKDCILLAEEKTPSVELFTGTNGITLTLDPVDGTASYASGGGAFSTIVGLHDSERLFYTLYYYPKFEWGRRVVGDAASDFGILPELELSRGVDFEKTIVYTYGDPEHAAPELYVRLKSLGYSFRQRKEFSKDAGSASVFFMSSVAGYFIGNPIVYDGLGVLHYGKAMDWNIESTIDLSKIEEGRTGLYRPGYYLVLKK